MHDITRIRGALDTKRIGRRMEHLESARSTNDEAWERIEAALGAGVSGTAAAGARIPSRTHFRGNPFPQTAGADGTRDGNPADSGDEMGISSQHSSETSSQRSNTPTDEFVGATPGGSITLEDADGLVILAEHQSAGRGRLGRKWESPRGASVLCSVAIVDERRELHGGELSLLAAVAVRDAVASCTEIVPTIKWPNDLLVSGKKLGGILVESRVYRNDLRAYVVGLGVNCLQQQGHIPAALAEKATSLELESRQGVDRDAVAIAVIRELDRWLALPNAWTYEDLRREWLTRCEPMGRRVILRQGGKVYSGSMLDIDPTAALVVKLDEGGIRAFNAADTTIVRGDCRL